MNIAHQITKVIQIVLMIGDKLASLKNNERKKTTRRGGRYFENLETIQ
jgi:predicted secreted acid phosphatase